MTLLQKFRYLKTWQKIVAAIVVVMILIASGIGYINYNYPTLRRDSESYRVAELQQLLANNYLKTYLPKNFVTSKKLGVETSQALFQWETANKLAHHSIVKVDGTIKVNSDEWYLLSSQRIPATPKDLDQRCYSNGRVFCADKTTEKLWFIVDGEARVVTDARFGSTENPTQEGSFTIQRKEADSWSQPYQVEMPFSLYFYKGEAIHYSQQFEDAKPENPGASAGCINLKDFEKAGWLFSQTKVGDRVIVYRSKP